MEEFKLKEGEVDTGTSIIAVRYKDGVVLAADSRTSMGTFVSNRVSDKLTPIHDRIYCCRSGSAADTQAVADIVKKVMKTHALDIKRLPTVKSAANIFRSICYKYKEQLMAGIIVAGYDEEKGGQVFSVPLGGSMVEQNVAIGGSGSIFMYSLVDSIYDPEFTREQCQDFCKKLLSHAMARDGSSGGVIRLVTIEKESVTRDFVKGDELPFMLS
eukprot:TRINITY_DN6421_c0_g1_i1.p1 TRINITY_DN6421_c0_g1~~TRINITY_DN6421_c0_g1_i1.p1  ORF type:complete len:214 (-),score=46.53 TRINITY_DN6421_c0_g1_i1:229-870(-)